MQVELLYCTPDFLRAIWCAARTCYSHLSPLELWENPALREEQLRLARQIIRSGHHSVLEHCAMTFAVAGVSRTLLAQYSRHRIGVSLSVQSQRHVYAGGDEEGDIFNHVVPPRVAEDPRAADIYRQAIRQAQEAYCRLVSTGVRKEDARFVLPGGAATNFITSLNLRSLMDVYHKRVTTPGAQWEIRTMVQRMADLIIAREPWLADYFPGGGTFGHDSR